MEPIHGKKSISINSNRNFSVTKLPGRASCDGCIGKLVGQPLYPTTSNCILPTAGIRYLSANDRAMTARDVRSDRRDLSLNTTGKLMHIASVIHGGWSQPPSRNQ